MKNLETLLLHANIFGRVGTFLEPTPQKGLPLDRFNRYENIDQIPGNKKMERFFLN